jgi:hypothetical protein
MKRCIPVVQTYLRERLRPPICSRYTCAGNQFNGDPNRIFPPNGQSVTVTLSGVGSNTCSGLASVSYIVIDEYGTTLNIPTRTLIGNSASWTDSLIVEASRHGNDLDGRLYRVVATITDAAGNTSTVIADIVIQHDRGNR